VVSEQRIALVNRAQGRADDQRSLHRFTDDWAMVHSAVGAVQQWPSGRRKHITLPRPYGASAASAALPVAGHLVIILASLVTHRAIGMWPWRWAQESGRPHGTEERACAEYETDQRDEHDADPNPTQQSFVVVMVQGAP
jgi:hypothetical protein